MKVVDFRDTTYWWGTELAENRTASADVGKERAARHLPAAVEAGADSTCVGDTPLASVDRLSSSSVAAAADTDANAGVDKIAVAVAIVLMKGRQ